MSKNEDVHQFGISLLAEVEDTITGYKGVVIRAIQYLTGCDRYCVQSKSLTKDGVPVQAAWFEAWRLKQTRISPKPKCTYTFTIPLGATVVDKVTKVEGVVVARGVVPEAANRISIAKVVGKAGDDKNWMDFDELQIEVKGTKVIRLLGDAESAKKARPGGPNVHPAPKN